MSTEKPNKNFFWNETETNIIEPTASKKQNGWNSGEKPPAQNFNWFWNIVGIWVTFLTKLWESGKDSSGDDNGSIAMTGKNGNASNDVTGENSIATGTSNIVTGDNSSVSGVSNNVSGIRSYATGQANDVKSDNTIVSGDGNLSETSCNNSEISGQTCKNYGASNRVGGNNSEAGVSGVNPSTQSNIDCFGSNNKCEKSYSFVRGVSNIVSALYGFILGGQNNNVNSEGSGVLGADGITNDRYYNTTVNELTVSQGIYLPTENDQSTRGLKNHVFIGSWQDETQNSYFESVIINEVGDTEQKAAARYFNANNSIAFSDTFLEAIYQFRNGNLTADELANHNLTFVSGVYNPASETGLFGESSDYSILFPHHTSVGARGEYTEPDLLDSTFLGNSCFQFWVKKPAGDTGSEAPIISKFYGDGTRAIEITINGIGTVTIRNYNTDGTVSGEDSFSHSVNDDEWVFISYSPSSNGFDAFMLFYSENSYQVFVNYAELDDISSSLAPVDDTTLTGNFVIGGDGSTNTLQQFIMANFRCIKSSSSSLNTLDDTDKERVLISAAQEYNLNFYSIYKPVAHVSKLDVFAGKNFVTEPLPESNFIFDSIHQKLYAKPFLSKPLNRIFLGVM